jgi:hypothetical protein
LKLARFIALNIDKAAGLISIVVACHAIWIPSVDSTIVLTQLDQIGKGIMDGIRHKTLFHIARKIEGKEALSFAAVA